MPSAPRLSEPEINLLTALRTAFSKDEDPQVFLARTQDQIQHVERVIIETCSKNRIRVDDNLYALLESRDGMAEQVQEVELETDSAAEITKQVNKTVLALTEKMQVRQNLDAALSVAAQTRKLTRMYARVEDTIDSRRLYTAFRMLLVLEEETRCVKPGTFLQELVPDTARLRNTITLQARKSFHSWIASVRKSEVEIGAYALHHAYTQGPGCQALTSSSQLGSMNSSLQGSSSSKTSPQPALNLNHRNRAMPWTPLLTSHVPSSTSVLPLTPPRSYSVHRIGSMTPVKSGLSAEPNFRPRIGTEMRAGGQPLINEYNGDVNGDAPTLHLRPLLQSVFVNDGLELLGDMRADYRRERLAHLRKILDEAGVVGDVTGPAEHDSLHQHEYSRMRQAEAFVYRVCGFFVVERTVELYANPILISRDVVDKEWWALALSRVQSMLRNQEDGVVFTTGDPSWTRSLYVRMERFAQTYKFACQ